MAPKIRLQMAQTRGGSWCGKAALLGHKIPLMPLQADVARALKTSAMGDKGAKVQDGDQTKWPQVRETILDIDCPEAKQKIPRSHGSQDASAWEEQMKSNLPVQRTICTDVHIEVRVK